MSKTIDEKVVEMRFDNKHFESNVQTTMSTLDKLKAKLNLTGASKGLENVSTAAKKVNMDGLVSGLNTVHSKFSALEVIGVGALLNIGNAAANAGKRLVSSLSGIQAAMAGFNEYSMTMNTVQTLVNSTGKSIKEVESQLKELDEYADKTVYSTADMFNNIYKFTNAGIDLDTAKTAMIGIANATAYAGQGAQQASIAYYNLAQSMSMGYLTTIDYKSLNLANIATKEFKQRMADAAVAAGTLKKVGDDLYSTGKKEYSLQALFTEGLKDQWATTNVMMDVFKQYGSQETEIGKKAWAAAQEVKTFGMMMESLQAQAGTGWKDTWQILFGSLDEAKRMWTGLANFIGKIIDGVSKWRNTILDIALNNPITELMEKVRKGLNVFEEVSDKVKNTTKSLEDYQNMITKIWRGDYKNQPYRKALVEAEGYNYEVTQSLVNLTDKMAGYGKGWQAIGQITQDDVVAAEKEFGIYVEQTTESMNKQKKATEQLTDERLKEIGLSEDEIYMYRQLEKGAKKYGMTIDELSNKMKEASGRDLLYGSEDGKVIGVFQNIGKTITNVFTAIKKGWTDTFEGITGVDLYMIIEKINKFTESIRKATENEDKMRKLSETFRGLFSIIHIVTTSINSGLKIAFQVLKGVLSAFNIDVLDFTSMIGNIIYNFDRWITENNMVVEGIKALTIWIISVVSATKDWITQNEKIMSVVNKIKDAFANAGDATKAWFEGLKETDNIPEYIFGGLINGIRENGPKVWEAIKGVAIGLVDAIKEVLKIHSPSKVMFAIGGFIIAGLIAGMKDQQLSVLDLLKGFGNKIIEMFKSLDLGNVIAVGIASGIIYTAKRMLDLADKLVAPIKGLTNVLNGLGSALSGIGDAARDFGTAKKYESVASIIKSIGISIGILALSLWILAKLPIDQLKQGAIALGAISLVLVGFIALTALLSNKLSKTKLPDMTKMLGIILGISIGMALIAKALKTVSKIEPDRMTSSIFGLVTVTAAMAILILTLSKVANKINELDEKAIKQIGKIFTRLATSMLLVAVALRLMSKVEPSTIWKAIGIIAGMVALLAAIGKINKYTENSLNQAADTIKAVGIALLLLVITMKLAGGLKKDDFLNGIKVIGVFSLLLLAMMGISKLFKGTEMIKVTTSILMATIAIGMLAVITKLIGNINPDEMKKGLTCVGVLGAIITALILVSKQSASLHGTTLVGVAMVMAAMGVMVFLLGQLDPEKAKNGIKAVGAISIFMAILLQAAKNFNPGANAVKTLTTLTVMISLLAVALIGLSFIDQQRLMTTAISLGAVMLSLAAVIAATNKLKVGKGVIKTLLTITLVVAAMAGIVALLSHFTDPNGAIASAGALSLLLVACSAIVVAMSKFKVNAKNAAKGALALTAMAVPLLAFTGVLALLSTIDASKALPNVLALIVLAGAMTGLLAALTTISSIGNIANMALGVLGLTLMAVPLLAFVGILALMQNVDRAMENVKALTLLATACTLLLIPLTAIGAIVATGVGALAVGGGILALTLMAVPLLAFVGVLAVMQGIENATQNVELLTTMMEKMTVCLLALSLVAPLALMADAAIFGLIGAITTIGVLATAVGSIMDKFPQLQDFLNKGLPVLEQIALSIGKIIGNVVAGFMNSVAEELPHAGEKLSEFAVKALPFITIMSSVSNRMTEGAKAIASSLLVLTGASLLDGIATFINGGESFSRLGIELSKFAVNALPFLTILSSVNPAVLEGSKSLASAVLEFTKANFLDTITSWINGESDLGSFGAKLAPLGTGMKEFVTNLGTFDDKQVATVKSACDALKIIAEVAGEIPKHGGIKQAFTGDNDIEEFGKKLGPTGTAIKEFVTNLGTFDDKQVTTVKSACDALKAVVEVAGQLPKHGGIKQAFTGDNDISAFAGKLGEVAKGIRGFVYELQRDNVITNDSINKINAVNNIMWAIADLGKINLGDTSGKLEELGARLVSFGNKITEYVKSINTVSLDDLQSSKGKIDKIIEIANTLAAVSSDPIEQLGEKLKNFATDALNKFVDGLNSTQPKDDATNAVKALIDAIISAMGEKDDDVKTGATNIIETATKALESSNHTDRASKAGLNILNGFINGMNDKDGRVWNKAYSIGRTAVDAINKATDEHSPSKETFKTGKFFDQGFINGIKSLEDKIYSETYGVGDKARLGLGRAIKGVSNLISEGIDDEFTIRPVLDLSDVQSGAAAINGMLGVPSVGVAANLNAISTGMRTYRQNGGDDVISAIDKLGKNLGNTTGDTYNINGITYDNGSEIQEAVSTLVRAARIERRT